MKITDLLSKLSELEAGLDKFSFEELSAAEAKELKELLKRFRTHLQERMEHARKENNEASKDGVRQDFPANRRHELPLEASSEGPFPSQASALSSSRFNAYLKESELSERQLSYINAILAAAEIDTRITNDPIITGIVHSKTNAASKGAAKDLKKNTMGGTRKNKSETTKSSRQEFKQQYQLDLKPILEDCLGKKELLEELISLFKQNALEFIGQLKIHLQNRDFEAIRFASHKIKSGLRMMNAQELLVIAEQIEIGSKTDRDIKHLNFLFDCFLKEYPVFERAMDEEFMKLN